MFNFFIFKPAESFREKNREKMKKKHDSSNSSLAGNFEEVDRADNEFRTKLDEQNRIFEEKMRRLKEKREEKEVNGIGENEIVLLSKIFINSNTIKYGIVF